MTQQKSKREKFAKPGANQQVHMLTVQVKNTMLHLNGQNLRLAAKSGCNSKTPGLHMSATHGKEAVGQFTASSQTQGGTAQLDLLLLKSPRSDMEREAENWPVRRPLKLAPLELPEEVKQAQRQKLKCVQKEAKPASCRLNVTVRDSCTRRASSCGRQRLVKAAVCSASSSEPVKVHQQKRSSRPKFTRINSKEQNGNGHLEDVVCQGTPAPMCSKPVPPLRSLKVKATRIQEVLHQNPGPLQQETGSRRVRLRRAQCLEEDQCNSSISGGLSTEAGKLAQGVLGGGQWVDEALKGRRYAERCIREPTSVP